MPTPSFKERYVGINKTFVGIFQESCSHAQNHLVRKAETCVRNPKCTCSFKLEKIMISGGRMELQWGLNSHKNI